MDYLEANIVRFNIENTDLAVSIATFDDDHTITAILKEKGRVVGEAYSDGSGYQEREMGETLLRWLIDGKD